MKSGYLHNHYGIFHENLGIYIINIPVGLLQHTGGVLLSESIGSSDRSC